MNLGVVFCNYIYWYCIGYLFVNGGVFCNEGCGGVNFVC